MAELLEQFTFHALAAGLGDAAQQRFDLLLIRQRQIQQGDAFLQIARQLPFGSCDHKGVRLLAQACGQVAQLAADAGVIAVAMEVVQHQQGRLFGGQSGQAVEGSEWIAGGLPIAAGPAGEATNEIPAGKRTVAQALGGSAE